MSKRLSENLLGNFQNLRLLRGLQNVAFIKGFGVFSQEMHDFPMILNNFGPSGIRPGRVDSWKSFRHKFMSKGFSRKSSREFPESNASHRASEHCVYKGFWGVQPGNA